MNMQRNSLPTTRETTWKGNSGTREGPRKVPWQRQFRDKKLPLHLQFGSLGRVVNSSTGECEKGDKSNVTRVRGKCGMGKDK